MNKKDLKKFLIENESHTIENTEEKLLSFVKGTMLNRNDVIDQDDQSHHRQEERLRNQLDKQVHEHHHHLEEIEALTVCPIVCNKLSIPVIHFYFVHIQPRIPFVFFRCKNLFPTYVS